MPDDITRDFKANRSVIEALMRDILPDSESDYSIHARKPDGIGQGYIGRRAIDGQLFMIKKNRIGEQHKTAFYTANTIEAIMGEIYRRLLGRRAPIIALVEPTEADTLAIRSKFLNDFRSISEHESDYTQMRGATGFEKVMAAHIIAGNTDVHQGNIGIMTDSHGKRVFCAIDHGLALHVNLPTAEDMWSRFQRNLESDEYPDLIREGNIDFDFSVFADNLMQMHNTLTDDTISAIVAAKIAELKKLGMTHNFNFQQISMTTEITSFDQFEKIIVDQLKHHRDLAFGLSNKIKLNLEFLRIVAPEIIVTGSNQGFLDNPIKLLRQKGILIENKDPLEWLLEYSPLTSQIQLFSERRKILLTSCLGDNYNGQTVFSFLYNTDSEEALELLNRSATHTKAMLAVQQDMNGQSLFSHYYRTNPQQAIALLDELSAPNKESFLNRFFTAYFNERDIAGIIEFIRGVADPEARAILLRIEKNAQPIFAQYFISLLGGDVSPVITLFDGLSASDKEFSLKPLFTYYFNERDIAEIIELIRGVADPEARKILLHIEKNGQSIFDQYFASLPEDAKSRAIDLLDGMNHDDKVKLLQTEIDDQSIFAHYFASLSADKKSAAIDLLNGLFTSDKELFLKPSFTAYFNERDIAGIIEFIRGVADPEEREILLQIEKNGQSIFVHFFESLPEHDKRAAIDLLDGMSNKKSFLKPSFTAYFNERDIAGIIEFIRGVADPEAREILLQIEKSGKSIFAHYFESLPDDKRPAIDLLQGMDPYDKSRFLQTAIDGKSIFAHYFESLPDDKRPAIDLLNGILPSDKSRFLQTAIDGKSVFAQYFASLPDDKRPAIDLLNGLSTPNKESFLKPSFTAYFNERDIAGIIELIRGVADPETRKILLQIEKNGQSIFAQYFASLPDDKRPAIDLLDGMGCNNRTALLTPVFTEYFQNDPQKAFRLFDAMRPDDKVSLLKTAIDGQSIFAHYFESLPDDKRPAIALLDGIRPSDKCSIFKTATGGKSVFAQCFESLPKNNKSAAIDLLQGMDPDNKSRFLQTAIGGQSIFAHYFESLPPDNKLPAIDLLQEMNRNLKMSILIGEADQIYPIKQCFEHSKTQSMSLFALMDKRMFERLSGDFKAEVIAFVRENPLPPELHAKISVFISEARVLVAADPVAAGAQEEKASSFVERVGGNPEQKEMDFAERVGGRRAAGDATHAEQLEEKRAAAAGRGDGQEHPQR
jgi:hypothetical protein